MDNRSSLVRVLGTGHLAAAVRTRLQQLRPCASDMDCMDYGPRSESAALFLACSDFENASLRRSLTERARADRSTLLFACLLGHSARVGPLITSLSSEMLSTHYLTRSWDFGRDDTRHPFARPCELPTQSPDTRLTHLAQIGATFIVGELAKLLERVTKIDSPTDFGQGWPQVFPEVHAGTLVVTDNWRDHCRLPSRTWHAALI